MNQFYYIDANTESVKLTTAPEKVETAYKNIFIKNFKIAKEFLTYGYKSKYDLEWDIVEAPPFGLEIAHRTINQIKELDDEFRKFVEEYADYGYRLEDLEKSDEWSKRNRLNNLYVYYYGFYRFLGIDYKDRIKKSIAKKNQYNFVRVRTKYNRSREQIIREQAQELFDNLESELKEMKEEVEYNQQAVGVKINEQRVAYRELHESTKLSPKRLNDIKNILIIYLSERESLKKKLRGAELAISAYCNNPEIRGKIVKNKDLSISDVRWSVSEGYNIYRFKKAEESLVSDIAPMLFTWTAYNRLANITKDLDLCRNEDWIIIDSGQAGEPLSIEGSFFDKDEYELTDNELALEAALNPILTVFYKERFEGIDD